MRFTPYDKTNLKHYKPGCNQRMLLEFYESEYDCVEIKDHGHKSVHSFQSNLCVSASRLGLKNVKIVIRGDKIFLVKVAE